MLCRSVNAPVRSILLLPCFRPLLERETDDEEYSKDTDVYD